MIRMQILNDHNDTIHKKSNEESIKYQTWNRTTPIQFQNSLYETTHVITRK